MNKANVYYFKSNFQSKAIIMLNVTAKLDELGFDER